MIHFVVALGAEARPFVEHSRLRRSRIDGPFTLHEGESCRLVVSGIGRVAAAAAAAWLHGSFPEPRAAWMNFGSAAHRDRALGTPVVAHRLVEAATDRSWYPPLVGAVTKASGVLATVDAMATDLQDDRLYDMEATAFFSTVTRWTPSELVRVVKVVSDRGDASAGRFERGLVEELIGGAVGAIEAEADVLTGLARRLPSDEPPDLEGATRRWRFSVTQRRLLGRQARRAAALGVTLDTLDLSRAESATQVIESITRQLDAWPRTEP